MERDEDIRKRLEERARKHPVRARILALHSQDKRRSLAAADLMADLGDDRADLATVAYHVRVLQDAGLLPPN